MCFFSDLRIERTNAGQEFEPFEDPLADNQYQQYQDNKLTWENQPNNVFASLNNNQNTFEQDSILEEFIANSSLVGSLVNKTNSVKPEQAPVSAAWLASNVVDTLSEIPAFDNMDQNVCSTVFQPNILDDLFTEVDIQNMQQQLSQPQQPTTNNLKRKGVFDDEQMSVKKQKTTINGFEYQIEKSLPDFGQQFQFSNDGVNLMDDNKPVVVVKPSKKESKKSRLQWTPALHQKFIEAVTKLGINNAAPKTILNLMNCDGLTTEHIKSHLQKYRQTLRKMCDNVDDGQSYTSQPATYLPEQQTTPIATQQPPQHQQQAQAQPQYTQPQPQPTVQINNLLTQVEGENADIDAIARRLMSEGASQDQIKFLMIGYKMGLKNGLSINQKASFDFGMGIRL